MTPTFSGFSQAHYFTCAPQSLCEVGRTDCRPHFIDGETEVEQPAQGHLAGSGVAKPGTGSLYDTVTHSRPASGAASSGWCVPHTASRARKLPRTSSPR